MRFSFVAEGGGEDAGREVDVEREVEGSEKVGVGVVSVVGVGRSGGVA